MNDFKRRGLLIAFRRLSRLNCGRALTMGWMWFIARCVHVRHAYHALPAVAAKTLHAFPLQPNKVGRM